MNRVAKQERQDVMIVKDKTYLDINPFVLMLYICNEQCNV
jgi:hypothetical protein